MSGYGTSLVDALAESSSGYKESRRFFGARGGEVQRDLENEWHLCK